MDAELDHVFVCPGGEADAAESALAAFGVALTSGRPHAGQGTRGRFAQFTNAYLELLVRDDADLAPIRSDLVRPLCLDERTRWRETGACPFGVAVRAAAAGADPSAIQTWPYAAAYLPPGASIPIVSPPSRPELPLVFVSPAARAPSGASGPRRRVTAVRISTPGAASIPDRCRGVCASAGVEFSESPGHMLELEWDGGRGGNVRSFAPVLPLSIRW